MNYSAFTAALREPEATLAPDIRVRDGADAGRRFGVYRNNIAVALIDALADTYPVVMQLVGTEFFRAMAREFARHHPPASPIMAHYGDGFADFVAAFEPAAGLPYLPDVARIEWQRNLAYHADDASALALDDVAALLAEPTGLAGSRWRFHPSAALVSSPFAVVSLWAAHQQGSEAAVAAALSGIEANLPESALVVRQALDVLILNLAADEARFIGALFAGRTLAESVGMAETGEARLDLALTMGMLLRCGALTHVESGIA